MKSTTVKISDNTTIDFGPYIDEIIESECREEAKEIVSKIIDSDDLLLLFETLKLYNHYVEKNTEAFILHLDYLKFKLIKDEKMNEGGCFGATQD